MAKKITDEIKLLFRTSIADQDLKEVSQNLKNALSNAVIGFDEAEIKREVEPIIRMIQKLFDKAEMKFNADELLGMPGRDALQRVANMTVDEFQSAFDRALAKSGGVKIDFGDVDLSAMTEPLERLTQELSEIGQRVASTTKKSVDEIESSIQRLNKVKPKKINTKVLIDGVEQEVSKEVDKVEQTVGDIEKTLNEINNPKNLTTEKGATRALEKARDKYAKSIANDDPWEVQYQHMISFVSKYEAMTKKIKPIVDTNRPEFKQLYDILSPKVGAAKISLEHFVDVARGNELSEYKNQPWARESTLKKVEQTLRNGILVKGDGKSGQENDSHSTPPNSVPSPGNDNENQGKAPNTKVSLNTVKSDTDEALAQEQKIINQKIQHVENQIQENNKKIADLTKDIAEKKTFKAYKGIGADGAPEDRDSIYESYNADYYSSDIDAAKSYATDEESHIVVAEIVPVEPLEFDARDYSESGDYAEVLSSPKFIADVKEKLKQRYAQDIKSEKKLQKKYEKIDTLSADDLPDAIQSLINEIAYDAGFDSVIFDNVLDFASNEIGGKGEGERSSVKRNVSQTIAVLKDEILKIIGFHKVKETEDGKTIIDDLSKEIPDYYHMPLQEDDDGDLVSQSVNEISDDLRSKIELEKQVAELKRANARLQKDLDVLKDKINHLNPSEGSRVESSTNSQGATKETPKQQYDTDVDTKESDAAHNNIQTILKDMDQFLSSNKDKGIRDYFDLVASGAYEMSDDVKSAIEATIGSIDSLQSINIGANNHGGLIGDKTALILRKPGFNRDEQKWDTNKKNDDAIELQSRLNGTDTADVNLGKIQEVIKAEEYLIELQTRVSGSPISTIGEAIEGINPDVLNASEAAIQSLIHAMRELYNIGVEVDPENLGNILYDAQSDRFGIVDMDVKHDFESFEEMLSAFAQTVRNQVEDIADILNDPNMAQAWSRFADRVDSEAEKFINPASRFSDADENPVATLTTERDGTVINSKEVKNLEQIKSSVSAVKDAVDLKTRAFTNEELEVQRVVMEESANLDNLKSKIILVKETLEGLLKNIRSGERNITADLDNIVVNVNHQNAEDVKIDAAALADAISKIQVAPDNEGLITEIKALVPSLGNLVAQEDTLQAIKAMLETKDAPVADKVPPEIKAETSSKRENRFERLNDIASLYEDAEDVDAAIKEFGELYKEIVLIGENATKIIKPNKTGINTLKKIANGNIDLEYDYSWVEFKRNAPQTSSGAAKSNSGAIAIDTEALRGLLDSLIYNVKIVNDDADKTANKIAIDESVLESTLQRVFKNILNPPTGQNDSEPKNEPWALEKTLLSVKEVLGQIQTNTVKPDSITTVPANTDVGNVLATENTLAAIKSAVEAINTKVVKGTKTSGSGGKTKDSNHKQTGVGKKNAESYAGSQYFPEKLKTQTMYLAKFRAQLMTTGKLTDDVDAQIYELLEGLKQVQNGPDFSKWNQQFLQLKTSVGIEDIFEKAEDQVTKGSYEELIRLQKIRNKLELQYIQAQDGSALKQFYATQLAQIGGLIIKQEEMLENEEYELKLAQMREEQARKLGEAEAKVADKDAKKTAADAKHEAKRNAMFGKAGSAIGKAESLWMSAQGEDEPLPPDLIARVDKLYDKMVALRVEQDKVRTAKTVTEEQQKNLRNHTIEVNSLTNEVSELYAEYQRLSGDNSTVIGVNTLNSDAGLRAYEQQLKQAVMTATNGKAQIKNFDAATKTLNYTVKTGKNEFTEYTAAVRRAGGAIVSVQGVTKKTETFIEATTRKMKEISSYMSGMSLVSRAGQELRRGIQYIREIDLALTELKKVTDETEAEYNQFLQTAAKTGARLGTTISAVTEATATFAKLGYSMEQATEMAEAAIVYKNVGDNIASTEDAADSIISTLKGFELEASETMRIVDSFNEVGNRFAITSQGIGEALRLSASALNEGGNSLDESIALITAANEVVNDPNSVGTALKTLTLRLRGAKTELEEMGEDVSDMATTTSSLQAKLLALTGGQVDIMLDENTFKNSTQILREMAEAWGDMTDIQRAAALELMGGKRQANVLSALIQNFDTVEKAIETSANSSGSALKENERYLDSIQGKIDQFNNAMQAMWSNALNSDMAKGIVEIGTEIIKFIDKIGLLPSVLGGVFLYFTAFKKNNPITFIKDIGSSFVDAGVQANKYGASLGSLTVQQQAAKMATSGLTKQEIAAQLVKQNSIEQNQAEALAEEAVTAAKIKQSGVTAQQILSAWAENKVSISSQAADWLEKQSTEALTRAKLLEAVASDAITKQDYLEIAAKYGLLTATESLKLGVQGLGATIKAAMASNPIGWIMMAISAVVMLVQWVSTWKSETEELEEKLSNLNSEISSIEGEITTLNSELETMKERMAELIALPSLSFVEQEELEKLRAQTAELERQLEIQELLLKDKQRDRASKSKNLIDSIWNGKDVDKKYFVSGNGTIGEDQWFTPGVSGKDALESSLPKYAALRERMEELNNVYLTAQKERDNGGMLSFETFKSIVDALPDIGDDPESYYGQDFRYSDEKLVDLFKTRIIDTNNVTMDNMKSGIETILGDMSKIISENELSYEMNDATINEFLDEYYAYTLAYQQAQGAYVKSDAISSMFDVTATKEMQAFGKALQEVANSDLTDEEKNAKILEQLDSVDGVLGDGVNKIEGTTDAYNRLHLAMKTVGVTAQDIADYFVLETRTYNSNTVEGILNQYKTAKIALENLKSGSINLDDLVKYDDESGEATGRVDAIAEQLKGVSPEVREQFTSIAEAIKEGSYATEDGLINWDSAIKKMELQGMQAVIANVKTELEATNKLAFPELEASGWIDSVDELSNAFESLASAMDLIVTAQEQMDNSGRISMKTALGLMETTDNWNEILEVNNGVITMNANAEQILIQSKLDLIKANLEMALQQVETDIATMESAINSTEAGNTLVNGLGGAIKHVQGGLVGLKAGWDALWSGGDVFAAIKSGYSQTIDNLTPDQTSLGELYQQRDELNKKLSMIGSVDTTQEFKNNYDFDETPGDKYGEDADSKAQEAIDAFQRDMEYWENRIGANQSRYEQVQNEIELLEARGKIAGKEYYQEQIKLEEQRLQLLNQQRVEAKAHLKNFAEGSDEWWEVANTLNDLEGEIDGVTLSIEDLSEAMRNVDVQVFEEIVNRFSNLSDELSNIRDILSSEDMFDEEGNWTEAGVAVLGTHIQDIEMYKQGLAETNQELRDLLNGGEDDYSGNEQAYYDRLQELTQEQHNYTKAIHDSEQSVVEMYENQIEAIEEYTQTLIDSYNDYIDGVKEALDAERDLYDFKKNVQKQSKDIAAIERRIASLSGSTNASDVAERRKLEAELYESRESLNDTYYDHAQQSQQEALDAEATAYEETITRFIEGLRIGLAEALIDMDSFLMGVTVAVSMNADTILSKYEDTGLRLSPELTNPWEAAKAAVGKYGQDALALMNEWTQDTFFDAYKDKVGNGLKAPWGTGTTAVNAFKNSVDIAMNDVVKKVADTVASASAQVSNLHRQILDTKEKAQVIDIGRGGGGGGGDPDGGYNPDGTPETEPKPTIIEKPKTLTEAQKMVAKIVRFGSTQGRGMNAGRKGDNGIITYNGKEYKVQNSGETHGPGTNLYKAAVEHLKFGDRQIFGYNGKIYGYLDGVIQGIEGRFWSKKDYNTLASLVKGYGYYAKGTTGTTRDEWAITDEPQFGDELVLVPGKDGNLSFMRKGTGVVPADMTQKLFELAQIPTSDLMNKNLTTIVPNITKNDFKNEFNFESLVHVDTVDSDTLPKLEKMVDKKIDDFSRALNYSLKKFTR